MSATRPVTLAACQFVLKPVADFDAFAAQTVALLDQARDADLVVFPELFTMALFTTFADWRNLPIAELGRIDRYTGAFHAFIADEARRRGQHILAGSHLEKKPDGLYNIASLYGPSGLVHAHAKTHIFPAESAWASREGDTLAAVDLPFGRVGVNICYELEIPECAASLAEQGAEIILCPSYTVTEHGYWRVRHCAQARAIENQLYVLHCATGADLAPGPLPPGWTRSVIVSPCDLPWSPPSGVLAEAPTNVEAVICATVDLGLLTSNRAHGAATTFNDRRRRAERYRTWPSHLDDPR